MTHSKSLLVLTFVAVLFAVSAPAQTTDATRALAAARQKENIEGDLKGAIAQYNAIATKYAKSDRAAAAIALLDMAEAYQKLGDAQARSVYERVVHEYADQKDAVTIAQAKLAAAQPQKGMSAKLLVTSSAMDGEGRISPDGRLYAITNWDTEDFIIHDFISGEDRPLIKGGHGEYAEFSAISRDGKQIAYEWNPNGSAPELRIGYLSGDVNPRVLVRNADVNDIIPLDWSPDGKSLAVSIRHVDRRVELAMIAVADGSIRALKSVGWSSYKGFLSPDGKWLAYDEPKTDDPTNKDVFALAVDGSREVTVAITASNEIMG